MSAVKNPFDGLMGRCASRAAFGASRPARRTIHDSGAWCALPLTALALPPPSQSLPGKRRRAVSTDWGGCSWVERPRSSEIPVGLQPCDGVAEKVKS